MQAFEGKVAVVTGAASGIGRGLVRQCAAEGMRVVAADVDEEGLAEIQAELEAKRDEAERIEALLRSPRELWSVVKNELKQIASEFADKRKTSLGSIDEIVEFDEQLARRTVGR